MKKFSYAMLLGCVAGAMVLSACNPLKDIPDLEVKKVVEFSASKIDDFYINHNPGGNGDINDENNVFRVGWNKNNASYSNDELHLKVSKVQPGDEETQYSYWGGEYRSKQFYGYGDYSVSMKPAKVSGVVSTFFLYTGEWDSETLHPSTGEMDTRNPDNDEGIWDEIDIEFLGNDTTKVQFNYTKAGVGNGKNEKTYSLGFDASKEYHTYGFRWEKNRITWFVDLKPVHTVTADIPTHPGRIIANAWTGSLDDWHGKIDDKNLDKETTYQWFGTTATGKETHKEEPEPGEGPITLEFNNAPYQCTNANGVSTIKYESISATEYTNVWANLTSKMLGDNNVLSFKVENKGAESARLYIEIGVAGGPSYLINNNDGDWFNEGDHRVQYNVAPGATRVITLQFDASANVDHIMIFYDSCYDQAGQRENGWIEISEVAFSKIELAA